MPIRNSRNNDNTEKAILYISSLPARSMILLRYSGKNGSRCSTKNNSRKKRNEIISIIELDVTLSSNFEIVI